MERKRLAIGIILLFIGTCISPTIAQDIEKPLPTLKESWLYVGGSGLGNYSSIQDAIDDANNGDTVYVYDDSSPYYEHVKIDKSISLLGENRETTIIDANMSGSPIFLEASNVIVRGFTIQNSGNQCYEDAGVFIKNSDERLSDSSNNKIIGNIIIQNHHGFYAYDSEHNNISDNVLRDNHHGAFYCEKCDWTIIQNNTITDNQNGICFWYSKFVKIKKNTIDDNYEFGVEFHGSSQVSTFNQVMYNSITNHKFGLVIYCEGNFMKYNYIANNSYGIRLLALGMYGARWNVIQSNTIASNQVGLILEGATWCKIIKNNFIGNTLHTTFSYWLPIRLIAPFLGHFSQLNTFFRNYWNESNMTTPQVIQGEMICYVWLAIFLSLLYEFGYIHTPPNIKPEYVPWKNYDWLPAKQPYDIPWMR